MGEEWWTGEKHKGTVKVERLCFRMYSSSPYRAFVGEGKKEKNDSGVSVVGNALTSKGFEGRLARL